MKLEERARKGGILLVRVVCVPHTGVEGPHPIHGGRSQVQDPRELERRSCLQCGHNFWELKGKIDIFLHEESEIPGGRLGLN